MLEPAVRCCTVPVLYLRRDIYYVAGFELLRLFPPLLVPAASACDEEDLTALVVDVPVVFSLTSKWR